MTPSALPDGEPAPADGRSPRRRSPDSVPAPFGVYVHVPFCAARCGYCDFNTYTATELGGGASRASYATAAVAEVRLARRVLGDVDVAGGDRVLRRRDADPAAARVISRCCSTPSATSSGWRRVPRSPPRRTRTASTRLPSAALREAGITRISFGMQSAVPHVLADAGPHPRPGPGRRRSSRWARAAGFDGSASTSSTARRGSRRPTGRRSLEAALATGARPRERLRAGRRGRYPAGARRCAAARSRRRTTTSWPTGTCSRTRCSRRPGCDWYEVSNWARGQGAAGRHNVGYWRGHDWWGVGPGAHSHVGGIRWWNVRHPTAYAERLAAGASPAQAREVLDARAAPGRAGAAGRPAARGTSARGADRPGSAPAPPGRWSTGCWTPAGHADGRPR